MTPVPGHGRARGTRTRVRFALAAAFVVALVLGLALVLNGDAPVDDGGADVTNPDAWGPVDVYADSPPAGTTTTGDSST